MPNKKKTKTKNNATFKSSGKEAINVLINILILSIAFILFMGLRTLNILKTFIL